MSKITYDNKIDLHVDSSIANINKVSASDMNEIKTAVNDNDDSLGDISTLTTTDKTSVVNAVNELNTAVNELDAPEKWVAVGMTAPTDGRRVWFKKGKNLLNLNRAEVTYSLGIILDEGNMYSNTAYDGGVGTSNTQNVVDGETLKVTSRFSQGVGFPIKCKPNYQYTLTLSNTNSLGSVCILFFDENNTYLSNSGNSHTETLSVTTPSNCKWLVVLFDVTGGTKTEVSFSNIQLEKGSTATTYEPYIEPSINVDDEQLLFDNYSTSEQVIGKWIDGKPIYRKVITFGALANNGNKTIPYGSSNNLIKFDIYAKNSTSGYLFKVPLGGTNYINSYADLNSHQIVVQTNSDRTNVTDNYVIVEYTKTTG